MKRSRHLVLLTVLLVLAACSAGRPLRQVSRCRLGTTYDVVLEGTYAYVTTNRGVSIVDVSVVKPASAVGLSLSATRLLILSSTFTCVVATRVTLPFVAVIVAVKVPRP